MRTVKVFEYVDSQGRSPFAAWFESLTVEAAAKVAVALYRLEGSNFSNVKGVGRGVLERRIDFGPGYRIHFAKDGERLLILLGGSGKQRQRQAILAAQESWSEYKRCKGESS